MDGCGLRGCSLHVPMVLCGLLKAKKPMLWLRSPQLVVRKADAKTTCAPLSLVARCGVVQRVVANGTVCAAATLGRSAGGGSTAIGPPLGSRKKQVFPPIQTTLYPSKRKPCPSLKRNQRDGDIPELNRKSNVHRTISLVSLQVWRVPKSKVGAILQLLARLIHRA